MSSRPPHLKTKFLAGPLVALSWFVTRAAISIDLIRVYLFMFNCCISDNVSSLVMIKFIKSVRVFWCVFWCVVSYKSNSRHLDHTQIQHSCCGQDINNTPLMRTCRFQLVLGCLCQWILSDLPFSPFFTHPHRSIYPPQQHDWFMNCRMDGSGYWFIVTLIIISFVQHYSLTLLGLLMESWYGKSSQPSMHQH